MWNLMNALAQGYYDPISSESSTIGEFESYTTVAKSSELQELTSTTQTTSRTQLNIATTFATTILTTILTTTTPTTLTDVPSDKTSDSAALVHVASLSHDDDRDIFILLIVWFSLTLGRYAFRVLGKLRRQFVNSRRYQVVKSDIESGSKSVNTSNRSKSSEM